MRYIRLLDLNSLNTIQIGVSSFMYTTEFILECMLASWFQIALNVDLILIGYQSFRNTQKVVLSSMLFFDDSSRFA